MPDTQDIEQAVKAGVIAGARELAADEKFIAQFWETGFRHLSTHASNNTSQWIGKRLLTSLIAAITAAGLIWLVKSGNIK